MRPAKYDMELSLEVVEAEPSHYPILGELTVRAYEPVVPTMYIDGYAEELLDVAGRAARVPILVALYGGFVVGGMTYVPDAKNDYYEFDDPNGASFRHLAVDPSAQGLGAGRALVEAGLERARATRRACVLLHTLELMTGAAALYTSVGFRRDPTLDRRWDETRGLAYRLDHLSETSNNYSTLG